MKTKQSVTGLVIGLISGLFGAGGGALLILSLEKIFKLEVHQAHATTVGIILPLATVSTVIYLWPQLTGGAEPINWLSVLYVSAGGITGGYLGARYFKKISGKTLHKLFGVFMMVAALMMIFR